MRWASSRWLWCFFRSPSAYHAPPLLHACAYSALDRFPPSLHIATPSAGAEVGFAQVASRTGAATSSVLFSTLAECNETFTAHCVRIEKALHSLVPPRMNVSGQHHWRFGRGEVESRMWEMQQSLDGRAVGKHPESVGARQRVRPIDASRCRHHLDHFLCIFNSFRVYREKKAAGPSVAQQLARLTVLKNRLR